MFAPHRQARFVAHVDAGCLLAAVVACGVGG
eukprot:CAMPEP_0171211196 /NCGR_PEP_ID=MMETSP0790-20130122/29501_1 /TAXON_ID=2925 /ORGANISM="Alexandrium catenella, Strain OF101" /LENGTH=30 /DNA_ID= /DNA_START= /DNA_END= /DNA_ORIENTATION=